jgi:hypothetical protein
MNFPLVSVLSVSAKISQSAGQKSCLLSCANKVVVRKYCKNFFLTKIHFLNMLYKNKFSKVKAIFKNINTLKKFKKIFEILFKQIAKSVFYNFPKIFFV